MPVLTDGVSVLNNTDDQAEPVIMQDTAVIQQGVCAPISTPFNAFTAPSNIGGAAGASFLSAKFIPVEQAQGLSSPNDVTFVAGSAFVAPDLLSAAGAGSFSAPANANAIPEAQAAAPRSLSTQAGGDFSAPIEIDDVESGTFAAPANKTAVAQASAAAPRSLSREASQVFLAPTIINDVKDAGFAVPAVKAPIAAGELAAPRSLSREFGGVFLAPTVINDVKDAGFAVPSSITALDGAVTIAPRVLSASAAGSFAVPLAIDAVSDADFIAPRVVSVVASANFLAPTNISGVNAITFIAPRTLTIVAAGAMAAARVLTPKPYSDLPPFPLTHPRILYQNLLAGSTVAAGGAGASNVLNPATYSRWSGTINVGSSAVITFTPSAALSLDCLAIGAHNLGSLSGGATIRCEYAATVGGTFVDFAPLQTRQGDNNAIMFVREAPVSCAQIRVRVTSGTGPYFVGVIFAGLCLQMQRPIYGGVNPITLNRVTDYFNNQSESGNWLGRQIRRRGLESSLSFERLTAPWYRQYFDPFVRSARELPFFFAWRPADYPAECAYCWTDGDIQPSNSGGGNDYMSVNLSVKAHA